MTSLREFADIDRLLRWAKADDVVSSRGDVQAGQAPSPSDHDDGVKGGDGRRADTVLELLAADAGFLLPSAGKSQEVLSPPTE